MRNAAAEGKEGAAACFSELSKVVSCKPFFFPEENPKAEGLLCFPGWWFGVFFPPPPIFSLKVPNHTKPKDTLTTTFQAVSQRDKEKEEILGKNPV